MNLNEIVPMVEKQLEERGKDLLGSPQFVVNKGLCFQDEESLWHIFVEADKVIDRRGQYYDILNDIEEDFKASHNENVMLVPVKPEKLTSESGV